MAATTPFRHVAAAIKLGLANRCTLLEVTAAVLESLRASVDDKDFRQQIDKIREGMPAAPYKIVDITGPERLVDGNWSKR